MSDLILPTARGADPAGGNLDDSVYNRLLKERIIFLGSEVTDQVANRICAQLLLLCAGTKGKRYALPHARIMMHQPSGGIGGTAADIAIQAEQMLYTKRMFQERVAFHTGQSPELIEADSDRDRWFTAEEARDYGFIDRVITRASQAPAGAGTRQ